MLQPKFEFKVIDYAINESQLNEYGAEGWHLAAVQAAGPASRERIILQRAIFNEREFANAITKAVDTVVPEVTKKVVSSVIDEAVSSAVDEVLTPNKRTKNPNKRDSS